jgi:hypothetical protein
MPTTYPPGFPTIDANGVLTISRWLNTPTLVERELRTLTDKRFIGDVLLSGRANPQGGAVLYETSESIYAARSTLEAILPGGDFPLSTIGDGAASIATVKKWGLDTTVTLESVMRQARSPVDRALKKLSNRVVAHFDSVALAVIQAAVTTTQAATAAWSAAGAEILLDLLTAQATIRALNEGYNPDTLVVTDLKYAQLMSHVKVQTSLQRERPDNPIYTGQMGRIAGLDIMVTANPPSGTEAIVLDRSMLGGIADERALSSGSWWLQETEEWRLRAVRTSVPFVEEPTAAVRITGV